MLATLYNSLLSLLQSLISEQGHLESFFLALFRFLAEFLNVLRTWLTYSLAIAHTSQGLTLRE
jgi:hypothetical protein